MSYLCLKRDIPEGEYKTFDFLGGSVIAKKEGGALTVAKNACKHRGMRVADGCGTGPIKCKYHGQKFNYEQALKHHEIGEFVFLPGHLSQSWDLFELSGAIGDEFGKKEFHVRAPFHLWMQNTMDPNHLSAIHASHFSKQFATMKPDNVYISEFESSFTMRLKDEVSEKYAKYGDKESSLFKSGWTHYMGFPNLSVTSFLGIFYSVESVAQGSGEFCDVTTRFFTGKGLKIPSLLKQMAMESNHQILAEDAQIVEEWARGYTNSDDVEWLPGEDRIRSYAKEIQARGYC